jgi:hypothetical protein
MISTSGSYARPQLVSHGRFTVRTLGTGATGSLESTAALRAVDSESSGTTGGGKDSTQ